MIDRRDHGPVTDADLVAWLDGMLDDEAAEFVEREVAKDRALDARVALLRNGERPFAEAFDVLLREAPEDRLKQILKDVKEPPAPEPEEDGEAEAGEADPVMMAPRRGLGRDTGRRTVRHVPTQNEPWSGWRVLAAAAVLLAVFAGGMLANRFVPGLALKAVSPPAAQGWREAVANYQRLFVKATFAESGHDWSDRQAHLRAALRNLGLDLDLSRVTVAPLDFKYANFLSFNGKPLVQMAYLYAGEKPVSFCIIRSAKPAHGIMAERRQGLNIAHWQTSEYGFMVIGDVPEKDIAELAVKLKRQLS